MATKLPSYYDFAHLTPKKQRALLEAHGDRWLQEAMMEDVKSSRQTEDKLLRKLLGSRCPRLEQRLFQCLLDGGLFWVPGRGWHRNPIRVVGLTIWMRDFDLDTMPEHEAIDVVFETSERIVEDEMQLRKQLHRVSRELNNRFLKRKLPFSVKIGRKEVWLTVNTKCTDEKPSRKGQWMSLVDCKKRLLDALTNGRRERESLWQEFEALGCRPSTFRRSLDQLKVNRKRVGYGAAGKWYVSLPLKGN